MRWRIGLLQDAAVYERQAARDAAKKEAERIKAKTPTVKTEAETQKDVEAAQREKAQEEKDKRPPKPKIKPLSETKAIETGANFISETFLFSVAAGLILFESWRSNRKAQNRRDKVSEQLSDLEEENKAARIALIELEREVLRLRAKEKGVSAAELAKKTKILPAEVYELAEEDKLDSTTSEKPKGWFAGLTSAFSKSDAEDEEAKQALATNAPGPAEKLLQQADKALEEKRKQRESEQEESDTRATSKTISSKT